CARGDGRREAASVPRARAPRRIVRALGLLRPLGIPAAMSDLTNFLAFLGLVTTLLMVWRQSRPGRVRLLAAQSVLLAAVAGVFLDVLVVVLVIEGLVLQIQREHASLDVDRLRELRG